MAWDIVFASETSTVDVTFECGNAVVSRIQDTNIVTEPSGLFTLNLYDSFSGGTITTGNLDVTSVGDMAAMQAVLDAAVPDLVTVALETAYNAGSGEAALPP